MQNTVALKTLVHLARTGDNEAFGKLYDMFVDAVYRFVYFRVSDRLDAQDITERVFVSMFTAISRYKDNNLPFESWMYKIARNKVIDHYRTKRTHVPLEQITEHPDDKPMPEELTQAHMTKEAVFEAMKTIPQQYREIIILKYIEDKTNEEISALLNKPISHVRVLQSRALAALRTKLNL